MIIVNLCHKCYNQETKQPPKQAAVRLSKKWVFEEAPSDEGAVSEADWGRDAEKSFLNNKIFGEIRIFSLPQSPTAPAPSSEGALGATETYSFSTD